MRRGLAAFAVSFVAASAARAEEPTQSYTLAWVRAEGTEACPPARSLRAEVERRLGRAVFDPTAERGFEVEVTRFGDKYRSDVFVRGTRGEMLGHRTLESDEPGCGALLNATALAIALVIDPEAASREPPAAPAQSAASYEPPAPPPVAAPPPPEMPPAAPPPTPAPVPVTPPAPRGAVALSVRGALQLGLVPDTAPGVALAFSFLPPGRWGFSIDAEYTASRQIARGVGSLHVGLTRASVLATFQLLRGERVRWLLAAGPSLGALHLAVREPTPVTGAGDYWFTAAQLGSEVQLHVINDVFVSLGASALIALRRQEFLARGQDEPIWSQPRFAGSLFGGVGAIFP